MIFQSINENDGWIHLEYTTTWTYSYDIILDFLQVLIDMDFTADVQRIASAKEKGAPFTECLEEVKSKDFDVRRSDEISKTAGVVAIAGYSNIMNCPFQIVFYNNTNKVRILCPEKDFFTEHGDHALDNHLNGIEIQAYSKNAVGRAMSQGQFKTK